MRTLQQILEDAGFEPQCYPAPFGESCLAFEVDGALPIGPALADIVGEIKENADQETVTRALRAMRTAPLGLDTIVYFPGVEYES